MHFTSVLTQLAPFGVTPLALLTCHARDNIATGFAPSTFPLQWPPSKFLLIMGSQTFLVQPHLHFSCWEPARALNTMLGRILIAVRHTWVQLTTQGMTRALPFCPHFSGAASLLPGSLRGSSGSLPHSPPPSPNTSLLIHTYPMVARDARYKGTEAWPCCLSHLFDHSK